MIIRRLGLIFPSFDILIIPYPLFLYYCAVRISLLFLVMLMSAGCVRAQYAEMPLLHATRGIHAGLYDPDGRYVLLRGANYNVLGEYWQGVKDVPTTKAYEDSDIILMEHYGFNCVRLLFTWSRLEPQRGQYDTAYIGRIRHAVEVAAQHHIYVLLDMHQDAWGIYVASADTCHCPHGPAKGWDGAPRWATYTDGQSTCTPRGRESAPAVMRAFSNFWDDRDSIQEHCIKGWAMLVSATARYSNVLGYDLINEPGLGERGIVREDRLTGRYYTKLIHAIRAAETAAAAPQHVILFEPSVTWRGKDYPSIPLANFRPERNIMFSPHHYFESLSSILTIEQGFGLMRWASSLYHTDLLIGEWRFFGGAGDTLKLKRYAQREDHFMIGSTWWQWSQACGDPHSVGWNGHDWQAGDYSTHLIELDRQGHRTGRVNEPMLHILDRARPLAVAGRAKGFTSDANTGELLLKGHSRKAGTIRIYFPSRFGEPKLEDGGNARISHTEIVAGGRLIDVAVHGRYRLHILGR